MARFFLVGRLFFLLFRVEQCGISAEGRNGAFFPFQAFIFLLFHVKRCNFDSYANFS
jgi:hypothetical protein